jgi:hypothetical protein
METVIFEPSRNGGVMARYMNKIAFPSQQFSPIAGEEWEILGAFPNPKGTVLFLTLGQRISSCEEERKKNEMQNASLYCNPFIVEVTIQESYSYTGKRSLIIMDTYKINKFLENTITIFGSDEALEHLTKDSTFMPGVYKARFSIVKNQHASLYYRTIEIVEMISSQYAEERKIYGGMTKNEASREVELICKKYNISLREIGFNKIKCEYAEIKNEIPSEILSEDREKFLAYFEQKAQSVGENLANMGIALYRSILSNPSTHTHLFHFKKQNEYIDAIARPTTSRAEIEAFVIEHGGDIATIAEGYYGIPVSDDDDGGFTFGNYHGE